MSSTFDPPKANIKDLFPAHHSRKIDILEQRISGNLAPLSNDAADSEKAEEEVIDSEEDEQTVTPIRVSTDETPKQNKHGHRADNKGEKGGDREPTHKYARFSQEEDRKIIEGYAKFGNKWDEIVRWGNLERSSSQISSRFTRKLCKSTALHATNSRDESDKAIPPPNRADLEEPPTKQRRVEPTTPPVPTPSNLTATISPTTPSTISLTASSDTVATATPNTRIGSESLSPILLRNGATHSMDTSGTKRGEEGSNDADHWLTERTRISSLEQSLKEREAHLVEWEARLKDWERKLQQKATEEHLRMSEIVKSQLMQRTRTERAHAQKKLAEDCLRFGQSSYERRGHDMVEVWIDGEVFRQIDDQLKDLAARREQLETKKGKKRSTSNSNTAELSEDADELSKSRVTAIKRDEAALQEERERLLAPKLLHMKELRRSADEEQSKFNNFPLLHADRYLLLSLLGKGGFSEVYRAFDLKELREVACKIHSVNGMWSATKRQNYTKHAMREYQIHKELVHPKVVRLYDVFEIDADSFCTVLEHCDGGDLDSYLKQHKTLQEREAKFIVTQIFSGLKYLTTQKRPIIHYDLKPGNILFHNGEVKITDFGLSKIMEEDSEFVELTSQGAGTYWYLPPECFEMGGKRPPMISSKVDVWSVGVIFYQLLYGKKPFGNDMSQQKFLSENVAAQTTRVDFPNKPLVSKEAKDFMQKCLTHNQLLRPDVQACCLDPFLAQGKTGSKKTAPVSPASNSNPQMPPPKSNSKRKIDSE